MLLLFLFVDLSRNRYRLSPFGFTRRPLPPVCSIVPNGRRSECGKIGNIPPSSQCFDQKHTRVQSTALDIYGVSLVGELDRLRGDDLEEGVDAAFVTIRKKLKGFLCRTHALLLCFVFENAQGGDIVFHFWNAASEACRHVATGPSLQPPGPHHPAA